jgi:hypothetical protein
MSSSSARDARAVITVENLMNAGAVIKSSRQGDGMFHVVVAMPRFENFHGYGLTFPDALHSAHSKMPAHGNAA